jgi:hypothetical protein
MAQLLAWADVPPVKGWFNPGEASVRIHIVQLDPGGRAMGKATRTVTRRSERRHACTCGEHTGEAAGPKQ